MLFLLSKTKLYFPVVTLSGRDNQKCLSKGFEKSVYWNEYKTKNRNKSTVNEYGCFLESNIVGVNRLFILAYANESEMVKAFMINPLILI